MRVGERGEEGARTGRGNGDDVVVARLSVWAAHPPPPIKTSSRHPNGVRNLFLDEKLNLVKASFRLYGIKHQIGGNHLYYFSYLATFILLF